MGRGRDGSRFSGMPSVSHQNLTTPNAGQYLACSSAPPLFSCTPGIQFLHWTWVGEGWQGFERGEVTQGLGSSLFTIRAEWLEEEAPARLWLLCWEFGSSTFVECVDVSQVISAYHVTPTCGRTHGTPAFQCPQIACGQVCRLGIGNGEQQICSYKCPQAKLGWSST